MTKSFKSKSKYLVPRMYWVHPGTMVCESLYPIYHLATKVAIAANLEGVVNQVLIYGEEGEYDLCLQYQDLRDFWWPNFIQIDLELFFHFLCHMANILHCL